VGEYDRSRIGEGTKTRYAEQAGDSDYLVLGLSRRGAVIACEEWGRSYLMGQVRLFFG